ncbi:MAG: serine/threonine-protein kinase [Gemmatimonadales bacterium]|nr:serine/threonine-protein kinase [Gemmatimonadales bacterium]
MSGAPTRLTAALAERYRVERELGAGGMATVYLAHDLKHERDVAIKVLHPDLGAALGGDRFLSEIRTTARLQHPHILPLLDSGEADGLLYYVMPLVTGETLRARLERERQLPIDDAVRIAREVADAVGYAHGLGVIHRDIKPENILLQGGHALVADFGIALAVSKAGSQRMTQTGLSLGTPQYMSPEQAMGEKSVDARSDVYALGAVTYEMLVGEPPFTGPTVQAIVARLFTEEPRSISAQRKAVPEHVEAVVMHALEKLPADRFATAAEFGVALADSGGTGMRTRTTAMRSAPPAAPRSRLLAGLGALAIGAVGLALGVALGRGTGLRRDGHAPPVLRFAMPVPDTAAFYDGGGADVAYAPDGSRIVYLSRIGLMMRSLDQLEFVPVPGGARGISPFFSPDGLWLGFAEGSRLLKVSLSSGSPVVICDSCLGYQFQWGADDTIRYHTAPAANLNSRVLMSLSARGGRPREIANAHTSAEAYRGPMLVPGTRTVLFGLFTGSSSRLAALDLESGRITRFDQPGFNPQWVDAGYVVVGTPAGGLLAVPFDRKRMQPSGAPIAIAHDLSQPDPFSARAAVARTGAIVYVQGGGAVRRKLLTVSRTGTVVALPGEARAFANPRISPDGRRLAVGITDATGMGKDVWIVDLAQSTWSRLTTDGISGRPIWTPDGRRLIYSSNDDLWLIASDGSGKPDSLLVANGSRYGGSVTPDGRAVIFAEYASDREGIRRVAFDSAPASERLLPGSFSEAAPALSPDGNWLAYQSEETGRPEVYVRPYPGLGARISISLQGGSEPAWAPNGRELFYRAGDSLVAAAIDTHDGLAVTGRHALFAGSFMDGGHFREYDVAPDGAHFIMLSGGSGRSVLIGLQNVFGHMGK